MQRALLFLLLLALPLVAACREFDIPPDPMEDLRINEIQVIGSHNSYKTQPSDLLQAVIQFVYEDLGSPAEIPDPSGLAYSHPPLAEQFETQGIRQVELDVWVDPAGGNFSNALPLPLTHPFGPGAALFLQAVSPALFPPELMVGPPFDPGGVMLDPGLKVFHLQDIDFRSHCLSLLQCLADIEAWSDANPDHLPILVLLELKAENLDALNASLPAGLAFASPTDWQLQDLLELEDNIRTSFHDSRIIQPNDVRAGYPTLFEGIEAEGWPRVDDARGKVMFALDNGGSLLDLYVSQYPGLDGALIFTSSPAGSPEAGFRKENDPARTNPTIAELVADGYLVRTRADADTVESRLNDPTRRDAALASGAQFVSTDYREPNLAFSDYEVFFPGLPADAVARCNPVAQLVGCLSEYIAP